MSTKIEIEVDIDDVFANMKSKEREEFMDSNLSECSSDALKDYVIENDLVSLDDFDDADIVNYLIDKGYTVS